MAALGSATLGAGSASAQVSAPTEQPKRETASYALSFVRGPGAESCPSRQELEREVTTRLGHSPFAAGAERSIEILTERTPEAYRSVVSVLNRDGKLVGRRVLVGEEPTCAPIFAATALAVALLIDPEAALSRDTRANDAVAEFDVEEAPPPSPAPPPAAPPAVAPPPQRVVALPPPVPIANDELGASVGADVVLAVGLVPETAPGAAAVFEGRFDRLFGLSVSATFVAKGVADGQDRTVDVSLTTFGVGLTLTALEATSFRLVTDAGLSAGALHASVRGGRAIGTGDHTFFGANAGVRAEARTRSGALFGVRLGGVVPLVRRGLSVQGNESNPIWTQPPAALTASLGAGWAFF